MVEPFVHHERRVIVGGSERPLGRLTADVVDRVQHAADGHRLEAASRRGNALALHVDRAPDDVQHVADEDRGGPCCSSS